MADQTAADFVNILRASNHCVGSEKVSRNHLWKQGGNLYNELRVRDRNILTYIF